MMKFVLFLAIVVACSAFMPHRPLVNGRTALMAKVKAEVSVGGIQSRWCK